MTRIRLVLKRAFWMGFAASLLVTPSALAAPADAQGGTELSFVTESASTPTLDVLQMALGACVALIAIVALRYTVKGIGAYRHSHPGHHVPA